MRFARRRNKRRINRQTLPGAAVLLAIVVAIVVTANWRLALLTATATGAIALTRMRYSPAAAIAALVIVLALAATARTAGSDDRSEPSAWRSCGALSPNGARLHVRARGTSCRRARAVLATWARERDARVDGYRCHTHTAGKRSTTTCRRAAARITARR